MLSTLLQPTQAANAQLSTQLISSLGGIWGNTVLQTEVAVSASLILVFASNTAIIGAYHVFMALSRMDFFPVFILKRNHFRDTPHWSIALATGIPITILLLVNGQINELGNLYAFGLLGAFTITCLGLDIIRYREWASARSKRAQASKIVAKDEYAVFASAVPASLLISEEISATNGHKTNGAPTVEKQVSSSALRRIAHAIWLRLDFWLGLLTTALVALAWIISLVSKPQSALFGVTVALIGMGVASVNYMRRGRPPVAASHLGEYAPDSLLALLTPGDPMNTKVIEIAINSTHGKPVIFLYLGEYQASHTPQQFEIVDPYLNDISARAAFGKAERLARAAKVSRSFVYRQRANTETSGVWKMLQPSDVILSAATASQVSGINPDRIRYESTSNGKIAHFLKHW